ncbi:hypothetical protein J3Q64DRAFT_1873017 [Phycomyces blakesleeanus]|uniref:START domain-containing protein n=1 Tax=Phycomyces blakesleeanus TaxID=4837 RepID=A0ABR3ALM1_PHYBL
MSSSEILSESNQLNTPKGRTQQTADGDKKANRNKSVSFNVSHTLVAAVSSPLPLLTPDYSHGVDIIQVSSKDKEYIIWQAEAALNILKEAKSHRGWNKLPQSGHPVEAYSKYAHPGDKVVMVKGQKIIQNFSHHAIFRIVTTRRLWDSKFVEGNLVEKINQTTSLTYEVLSDTVQVERTEYVGENMVLFVTVSVQSQYVPSFQERHRKHTSLRGWIIERTGLSRTKPSTEVTYVTNGNFKGLASSLSNWSLRKRVKDLCDVESYFERNSKQLKTCLSAVNGPQLTVSRPPAATQMETLAADKGHYTLEAYREDKSGSSTKTDKFSAADTPTNSRAQKNQLSGPILSYSDSEPSRDEESANSYASKSGSDHDKRTTDSSEEKFEASASITCIYPPNRHAEKKNKALKSLAELTSSMDGWVIHSEKQGVTSRVYFHDTNNLKGLQMIRCDGVINGSWTAAQLCNVVRCFVSRSQWDERFEAGRVIERFSESDALEHWVLKSLYPIQRHDACVVTGVSTNTSTGTVFVASTSVVDNKIQERAACYLRSKVILHGWVFRPIFQELGSKSNQWCAPQTGIKVTFVSKIVYESKLSLETRRVLEMEALEYISRIADYTRSWRFQPFAIHVKGRLLEEEYEPKTGTYHLIYVARHDALDEMAILSSQNKKTTIQIVSSSGFDIFVTPRDIVVEETRDGSRKPSEFREAPVNLTGFLELKTETLGST